MMQFLQIIVLLVLGNGLEGLALRIPTSYSQLNQFHQPSKVNHHVNSISNSKFLVRKSMDQNNIENFTNQANIVDRRDDKEEEERKRIRSKQEEDENRRRDEERHQAEENQRKEEERKRDEDRKREEERHRAEDRQRDEDNKRREDEKRRNEDYSNQTKYYSKLVERMTRYVPKEITTILPTPDAYTNESGDKRQNLLRKYVLLTKLATVTAIDYEARKLKSDYNQEDAIQNLSFITEKLPRAGDILSGND